MYRRAVEHAWGDLAESKPTSRAAVDRVTAGVRAIGSGERWATAASGS